MAIIKTTKQDTKPFLKWAGGKTQLLAKIEEKLPHEGLTNGTITKYVEPFVGSGAVLFYIMRSYPQIKEAYINDINPELMNTYNVIKENVSLLISILGDMEKTYLPLEHDARKKYYYHQRDNFNITKPCNIDSSNNKEEAAHRAAQFIFLNRTCFNGLYRVNKKGKFNVPMGKYKNPTICNTTLLKNVNEFLQNVSIYIGDYRNTKDIIDDSTFVYFDPPYRPINKSSNFTAYSNNDFNDTSQIELCRYFKLLNTKKAHLMLSNSDPKNENPGDNFFDDLYRNFNVYRVDASRRINSNASKRGTITELLVTNY